MAAPFPGLGLELMADLTGSSMYLLPSGPDMDVMRVATPGSCCWDSCIMADSNLELSRKIKPFSPKLLFAKIFYQSNRKQMRNIKAINMVPGI